MRPALGGIGLLGCGTRITPTSVTRRAGTGASTWPPRSGEQTAFLAPVGFERVGNTAKIPRKETGPAGARNQLIEDRLFGAVAIWRGRAAWTASVAERAMNRCNGFRLAAIQAALDSAMG